MTTKVELDPRLRGDIKLELERIKSFLEYIGNPQDKFKSVIIGGTNGKGSVTFYLSNLACKLTKYKIGRYISPHLISWNERFIINEKSISNKQLENLSIDVIEKVKEFEKEQKEHGILTEFEIYTAIAFELFAKEKVDLAFLEVGMGGRLDATNVIDSKNTLCSIITNVSLDHTQYLGKTIKEIAFEKAGIIKENNFIVTGTNNEALDVISKQAKDLNAKLISVELEKSQNYIQKNIRIALVAWNIISKGIEAENLKLFLEGLTFPGRFQCFEDQKILVDGAHNPDGAIELRKSINEKFQNKKTIYIIGILDKDYKSFIQNLIPQGVTVICTEPKSKRATKKELLYICVRENNSKSITAINLQEAINQAKEIDHDLIVITGSLYLVGEALSNLRL